MAEMAHLMGLPAEILHHIFQWLTPADVVHSLPLVNWTLHDFLAENNALFRDVYMNNLDTPEDTNLDWTKELRDLVKLDDICHCKDISKKTPELAFVFKTVDRLLKLASSQGHTADYSNTHCASRNATALRRLFRDDSTREAFLQRSSLFERVRNEHQQPPRIDSQPRPHHQQSAKLHCLYGRPILNVGRLRSTRTYPYACSKVYDLRQYTELTQWGPFMNDGTGRVDWEKVEAILVVLGNNLSSKKLISKIFTDIWDSPFSGSWPGSYMPAPKPDITPLEAKDPYGVTGTWYRIVCFLDYNDFFSYNFPLSDLLPDDAPRPALNVGEAIRLIVMRAHVTRVEAPGPNDGQDLPVVHFRGESRSLDDSWDDNASSQLRGTVRLTKEGEVQWTTFSIFHGQERWRSEGVQVGGVRSARGIVGNWFDRDYDPHGPAGPTAFWKATDSEGPGAMPNDFFLAYSAIADLDDSDPEAEMDYTIEEEDEEEEDEMDFAPLSNELPGLLQDARLEILDLANPDVEQGVMDI